MAIVSSVAEANSSHTVLKICKDFNDTVGELFVNVTDQCQFAPESPVDIRFYYPDGHVEGPNMGDKITYGYKYVPESPVSEVTVLMNQVKKLGVQLPLAVKLLQIDGKCTVQVEAEFLGSLISPLEFRMENFTGYILKEPVLLKIRGRVDLTPQLKVISIDRSQSNAKEVKDDSGPVCPEKIKE